MDLAGDSVRHRRSSGDTCMEMLKLMTKDQILEIISQGICQNCDKDLQQRIHSLNGGKQSEMSIVNDKETEIESDLCRESSDTGSLTKNNPNVATSTPYRTRTPEFLFNKKQKEDVSSPSFYTKNGIGASPCRPSEHEILLNGELSQSSLVEDRENERFEKVNRTTFSKLERINGEPINIVEGLELHSGVFNVEEQNEIVQFVYKLQHMGREGMLKARTYSEPQKWIRGKGRVTIQFGCCYNYAQDKNGNPPGIKRDEEVDPLPSLFKQMIKRMVRWHVLPPSSIPDSCIVNIYEKEDCIPPHIDHHDFVRPFCTVSLLSQCNIVLGTTLKILSPGEFSGPVSIPLPVGSVMVFNGNGADVAKHCVPSVPAKRISITFRKMDDSKLPFNYSHDPELLAIKPLINHPITRHSDPNNHDQRNKFGPQNYHHVGETRNEAFHLSPLKRSIQSISPVERSIQSYEPYHGPLRTSPYSPSEHEVLLNGELSQSFVVVDNGSSVEKSEHERCEQVDRRAFSYHEKINGEPTNILEGLELHNGVFNMEEQDEIVQFVYKLQHLGRDRLLQARTYSEPRKWIRGKGRVTIQFGCCYNYARDKNGNPPGIVRDGEVDPLPSLFKQMIKRMVQWHVLPPSSVPDSCIVNIYDEEDCIPPHIDHHDFVRPFCTVSLLSECNILFGTSLKILSPGEFSGPVSIPLPVGSVMVFNGNGADVAKHCIPSVPAKRISITFRKMDTNKLPFNYSHDPELMSIRPLADSPFIIPSEPNDHNQPKKFRPDDSHHTGETRSDAFHVDERDEFYPQQRPLIYSPFTCPSAPNDQNQQKKIRPEHSQHIGETRSDVFHVERDEFYPQQKPPFISPAAPNDHNQNKFRPGNYQHIGETRSDVFHLEGDEFSPQQKPLVYSPFTSPAPNGHNQQKKFRREYSQHIENTRSDVFHVERDEFSSQQRPLIYSPFTSPSAPNDHNQHKRYRRGNSQHIGDTISDAFDAEGDALSSQRRLVQSYGTYPTEPPRRPN